MIGENEKKVLQFKSMMGYLQKVDDIAKKINDVTKIMTAINNCNIGDDNSTTYKGKASDTLHKYIYYMDKDIKSLQQCILFAEMYINSCMMTVLKEDETLARLVLETMSFDVELEK